MEERHGGETWRRDMKAEKHAGETWRRDTEESNGDET